MYNQTIKNKISIKGFKEECETLHWKSKQDVSFKAAEDESSKTKTLKKKKKKVSSHLTTRNVFWSQEMKVKCNLITFKWPYSSLTKALILFL